MLLRENLDIDVYGTLDKPVHAINVNEYIKKIKSKNYDSVLAVDACLSTFKNQGTVEVREGPITPGKGIGKILPEVGDFSIIGIVDTSEKEFHDLVQDTRLSLIYEMAETISKGIITAIDMNEIKSEACLT
jgi:putative sporulation protein YyaC